MDSWVTGQGKGKKTPISPHLSLFLTVNHPLGTNFFLSPAKIFVKKIGALKSICRFWWLSLKLSDLVYFDSLTLVKLFTCASFHC